jgi:hypothetical protein
MIKRLEAEGLITSAGGIDLTAAGRELAQRVVRRHRLAERFLTDVLQLSWAEAHHEAGKWEHIMSPNVEEAMNRLLGEPTTCPHGNPIPGSGYIETDVAPLSTHPVGQRFIVRRLRGPARPALPLVIVGALTLAACGETYVDSSATTAPSTVATTLAPVAAGTPLPELFGELDELMRRLDELIVDDEGDDAALARIEEVWAVAEQQIRDRDPDDLYPFEQAITLARSGVERRRPADASKGYKLLVSAVDTYDTPA